MVRDRESMDRLGAKARQTGRPEPIPQRRTGGGGHGVIQGVRFVLTLDADTKLPPQSALRLVEAMAHPLNHPVLSPDRRVVCEGYGIIQPRVVASLPSTAASRFSTIFADARGT